jgi:hypothetical protein
MQITKIIQKKNPLNFEELKSLWDKMVEARKILEDAQAQLDAQKDAFKGLKEQQEEVIDQCFSDYKRGYSVSNINCTISYDGKIASYYDVISGEKVEGMPIEDGEQLEMTGGKRIDAEDIIRADNKENG